MSHLRHHVLKKVHVHSTVRFNFCSAIDASERELFRISLVLISFKLALLCTRGQLGVGPYKEAERARRHARAARARLRDREPMELRKRWGP